MINIPLLKKVMPANVSSDASEADPAFPVTESGKINLKENLEIKDWGSSQL